MTDDFDDRAPRETDDRDDGERYVEVPHAQLAAHTLERLLADVALRDDTDYGDAPRPLAERVTMARAALERGELVIVFDLQTETAAVLPRKNARTRG